VNGSFVGLALGTEACFRLVEGAVWAGRSTRQPTNHPDEPKPLDGDSGRRSAIPAEGRNRGLDRAAKFGGKSRSGVEISAVRGESQCGKHGILMKRRT
jgi:hypothetical protein